MDLVEAHILSETRTDNSARLNERHRRAAWRLTVRTVRPLLWLVVSIFAVVAFLRIWSRAGEYDTPSLGVLTAAFGLCLVGQFCLGRCWVCLAPEISDANRVARIGHVSQISKYVPAGFSQVAAHIGLDRITNIGARATVLRLIFLHTLLVLAGFVMLIPYSLVAWQADLKLRILALVGFVGLLGMSRKFLQYLFDTLRKYLFRVNVIFDVSGIAHRELFIWSIGFVGAHGLALSVLLTSVTDSIQFWPLLVYGLAFNIGLLALPIPSGLIIRESALVLMLPWLPAQAIIIAAVFHRLVSLAAELAALGGNVVVGKYRQRKTDPTKNEISARFWAQSSSGSHS
jgi:hypothetical protein